MSTTFKEYQKALSNYVVDNFAVQKHKMNKVNILKEKDYSDFYKNYFYEDDCFDEDYRNYINWLLGEI